MESPDSGRAVALEFPVSGTPTYCRVPNRIRKRLLAECKTPSTVEEIEAKLRHADLRRQRFYENVSTKARPKPRSPSRSSSSGEEPGQRLEAKLQAAEQKRLSILAKSQMRLARLDELRQAAKTGVEMRFEREREKLVTRVESRVQQAEANRMLILKAYNQRRATLKERSSQSLIRRVSRESKYKECVRAAIHQKRMAAEKKRQGLLDAEKKKAHARVLQVRRVAKSVYQQREVERSRMRDQLEDRLQRAKRQRAEYLKQRGRTCNSVRPNWSKIQMQADMLSVKLARCWKQFLKLSRTTLDLAKAFDVLKINVDTVVSMPFERLALLIESNTTLQTMKALLDRIENRLKISKAVRAVGEQCSLENVDHLLKSVTTPRKRITPRASKMSRDARKVREAFRSSERLSRYPVRIVLCAYMILGHPDAVLSGQGEREVALARSAETFVREFQLLVKIILEGPVESCNKDQAASPKRLTLHTQLNAFDKSWCSYLSCFVAWKVKDAQSLEEDLIRAACHLELSMIQKCKLTPDGENSALTHDMKAIQRQVAEDQKLLREKVQHLSGEAGIQRMEVALSEMRATYFQAVENGNAVGSPVAHIPSPSSSSLASTSPIPGTGCKNDLDEKPKSVARKLFKDDNQLLSTSRSPVSSSSDSNDQFVIPSEKHQITENELIVNEFLHKQNHGSLDSIGGGNLGGVQLKVRETIEKAFWDDILEATRKVKPDYDRVIQLVKEVRDEICEIAPLSWKEEIIEAIDLEIFSQVLKSGNLDIDYLGRIFNFALVTLQKLSSPASDDEIKAAHKKLLVELVEICQARESSNSPAFAMIRGLRFVLEQIQALKREISRARIQLMEPLLKGPAGVDYLQKAFTNRYGSSSAAHLSLPLTWQWLSSVSSCRDSEWVEHTDALQGCADDERLSQTPVTLRTGGSLHLRDESQILSSTAHAFAENKTGQAQPECNGEVVDLLVKLGLVKLVSGVQGLTSEVLPETFMVNLSRLRRIQAEIQKIIVVSTSVLICRQTLLSEPVATPGAVDTIVSKCTYQLLELLDRVEDVGLEGIVDVMMECLADGLKDAGAEKVQARKLVMSRTLAKSLQAGNAVFEKVSVAVYKAVRGVALGGSGLQGRRLAEATLRQVGASLLTPRVVAAAEVLIVAASVSISIHGPWYKNLVKRIL